MVGHVCVSNGQNLITSARGEAIAPLLVSPLQSCHQSKQVNLSAPDTLHTLHSVPCGHLFPVISSLIDVADITIAAILSHPVRLSQEMMTCLTRSFPNELDAGYFEAPCLQSRLRAMR